MTTNKSHNLSLSRRNKDPMPGTEEARVLEQYPSVYYEQRDRYDRNSTRRMNLGIAALVGSVVAGGAVAAVVHAANAEKASNHRHDVALEKVIKPTAVEIAQYAIDHSSGQPQAVNGKYDYYLGSSNDGKTTLSVQIEKIKGKAPRAADVKSVFISDWMSPGADGEETGPENTHGLLLEGSTWTAGETIDTEAPYGDTSFLDTYSSIKQPMDIRDFTEIVDDARVITERTMEQFESFRAANNQ